MRSYQGTIHAIRGSLVDIRFMGKLPPLRRRLVAGDGGNIVIEVLTHESEARQESITAELLEVVSGFMVLVDAE